MSGHEPSVCELCRELASGELAPHPEWEGEVPAARAVARWGELNVVSGLVPIVAGHLLVFPDQHLTAFSQLSDGVRSSFESLAFDQFEFWRSRGSDVLAFEHGTGLLADGSDGVAHAHVHLVPVADDAAQRCMDILKAHADGPVGTSLADVPTTAGYLMGWRVSTNDRLVLPGDFPSQTLRRLVAAAVDSPWVDWHDGGNWDGFARTERRLVAWAGQRVPITQPAPC